MPWWQILATIAVAFLVAWIIYRIAGPLSWPLARIASRKHPNPERLKTLHSLVSSTIGFLAFFLAALVILSIFVRADTLVWLVGLFSAAFGLAARPVISDVMTGIGFLFEDSFSVGEKVEILEIEGVIEEINLRSTLLRSPSGELFIIPNGEIRLVRNFSRGRFSTANVTLHLLAADLGRAIPVLTSLGEDAVRLLPNLLEPWQVISATGVVGQVAELTVLAKARFGQAAEMRPRMIQLIQEKLAEEGIQLSA
jgi:small conductance mechanosensitive channel